MSGWDEQKRSHRVLRRCNYKCYVCGGPAVIADHIVPIAQGGSDNEANMDGICTACHKKKIGGEAHA